MHEGAARLLCPKARKDWADWQLAAHGRKVTPAERSGFTAGFNAAITMLRERGVVPAAPIKEVLDFPQNGV